MFIKVYLFIAICTYFYISYYNDYSKEAMNASIQRLKEETNLPYEEWMSSFVYLLMSLVWPLVFVTLLTRSGDS